MSEHALPTLGPYELLETLGSGGMGVVYRARHLSSGELAAVKTVRVPHEGLLSGIRREIHALARIHHPGIVRIMAEGMEDGLPWYAMELLRGTTLRNFAGLLGTSRTQPIPGTGATEGHDTPTATMGSAAAPFDWDRATAASPGTLTERAVGMPPVPSSAGAGSPGVYRTGNTATLGHAAAPVPVEGASTPAARGRLDTVLTMLRRLCEPLAFLHGEGIVHRDLKPENVFVRPNGMPVLMDFGLISLFGGKVSREVLETEGHVLGTVAYMAPEQIQGELLDARADLYALGCILYELLTGRPPFLASTVRETLEAHLRLEPTPPSSLVLGVTETLDELVLRLLAKKPSDRLGYAEDVAAILATLGAQDGNDAALPKPKSYLYRSRLVGREAALRAIDAHLEALSQGLGAMLIVGGESGVGKTRLAVEVGRKAKRGELRVLSGECMPRSSAAEPDSAGSVPLQALRRPLQKIADWCLEWGWERAEHIVGRHGRVLAPYAPGFAALPGQDSMPELAELPPDAARVRLFTSLAEVFSSLAGAGGLSGPPLLLILDDLQWADDLTLELLEFFLRGERLSRTPMLIMATYRTDELGAGGRLGPLERFLKSSGTQVLRLGRLDEEAVGGMVCDMLALSAPPAPFVRYLTEHSEGNPFFVAEYLHAALERGVMYRDPAGRWQVAEPGKEASESAYQALPLPHSLRELVGRRLVGLPRAARRLADCAAVLGRESSVHVVWTVSTLADAELLDALTELTHRDVLEAVAPARVRFVHEKLREIVYDALPPSDRVELHQAAAEALEAMPTHERDEHLAEIAGHWERAFVAHKARQSYLAAARKSVSSFAYNQAERLYRSYLALVRGPTSESVGARVELARDVLFLQGRSREALAEYQVALDEAKLTGDRDVEGAGLLGISAVHQGMGGARAALVALDRAYVIYEALGNKRLQARTLSSLGRVYASQGRIEEGRATLVQAYALHRELGDTRAEAMALSDLAELHRMEGTRLKQARILFKEALRVHRQAGDQIGEGVTVLKMAAALRDEGRIEEARESYDRALAIHQQVGNRRFEAYSIHARATLEREAGGDLAVVETLISEAEAIFREVRDPYGEGFCLCERGHVALARGQGAKESLQRAEDLASAADAGPQSELGRAIARLRGASEAAERGLRLFRGERLEDLPRGLRQWLSANDQSVVPSDS